jgi:hypothetical protein
VSGIGRLVVLLAAAVGFTAVLAQQQQGQDPPNTLPLPPGFNRYAPGNQQQLPPPPAPQQPNAGTPLFGQSWPHVGPDPAPRVGGANRCPSGYLESANQLRVAHLVVCVVAQPNYAASYNGRPTTGQGYPNISYPDRPAPGQPQSSLPPTQERTSVNQCVGRPAGSYACGRGGTECCGATQDNMCFAGAFACNASVTGTGPKTACCISK